MTATIATKLFLVDSSGWLEFITDDEKAGLVEPYLAREESVLVPTVVIYEVCKRMLSLFGSQGPDRFLSFAFRRQVVALDEYTAIAAAEFSLQYRLPMADSLIYATAQRHGAELITTDAHFQNAPGVTLL